MRLLKKLLLFKALALFFVVIISTSAQASELSGVVRDTDTGNAVEMVSVRITELNTGTLTGKSGAFTFKNIPDGDYTIRVSLIGYAPVSLTVNIPGTANIKIMLTSSPVVVDEIVSTARGRQTRLKDIPGSVEVLNDNDFHEMNPVSIADALSRKPGIAVSSTMPWGGRAVIRGLTKDQVILLVDGSRVVTATAVPAQFGTIAQGDIERIEVLKGPISVLYGSGSTGGVVNIITRKGHFTPGPHVGFSLNPGYESAANGLSSYERVTVSSSGFYLNLSQANRKYTDYRTAGNERIPNSQFQDRQTQLNMGIRLSPRHSIEARYQYFSVIDVGIPGGAAFPPKAIANYPTTSRTLTDINWTWRPAKTWLEESKFNVYYQPVVRDVKILPNIPPSVQPHSQDAAKEIRTTLTTIHTGADHDVYGFRWQNVLTPGSHHIVAGLEGWQKNMESDRSKIIKKEILYKETGAVSGEPSTVIIKDTPIPKSFQRPVGIFAEDAFPVGERTKLTLGGRIDHIHTENEKSYLTYQPTSSEIIWDSYNDDDLSWSFVAGAVFKAAETVDFNLTLARSFRSPTIEERYLYADLGGVLTVGDPEIDSEKGTFFEVGVSAALGDVKLNGQVFLNSITDMVIKKPGGELKGRPADYQYANAGKARLWGFEARADWIMLTGLLLSADVSYVRGTDEKYDTDLPQMPPLTAHFSGRRSFGKGFWVEPLLTLVNKQDKLAPGERKTAGYGILGISAGKSIIRTGNVTHDLVLGIKNLGDKLYRDHMTVSRGYEMYGMGRSFYVSWRMKGE